MKFPDTTKVKTPRVERMAIFITGSLGKLKLALPHDAEEADTDEMTSELLSLFSGSESN